MNKIILLLMSSFLLYLPHQVHSLQKHSTRSTSVPHAVSNTNHSQVRAAIPLDTITANFAQEASKGTPISSLTVPEARNVLEEVQSKPIKKPLVDSRNVEVPFGDKKVSIYIVKPLHAGVLPVVLYIHGGGWILGSAMTHDRLIRELAVKANAAVVFVNYSRSSSKDGHYPLAINESYAVLEYLVKNGSKYKIDASHLAIAGDSVGGNIAIVVALLAKQRKGPKIDFQLLFYPVTDSQMNTSSYKQFEHGPWLTKASMEWFWDAYSPNVEQRSNPLLSPLQLSIESLKGLPPTLIITAENDVLRDEGEQFAHKLIQAQVPVTAIRIIGGIHDFAILNGLAATKPSKAAI